MTTPTSDAPKDLIGFLDFYLVKKAPFQIPDTAKEWIVQFGPWITVVLLILTLPILLFALGIGADLHAVRRCGVCDRLRRPHLVRPGLDRVDGRCAARASSARKMAGWRLLFYSQLVSILLQPAERQRHRRTRRRADFAGHLVSGETFVQRVNLESKIWNSGV